MTDDELDVFRDPAGWDAYVAASPHGEYLQTSAWANVKAANGWRPYRVMASTDNGPVGAQVLIHRLGRLPFSVGYAPGGPVADELDSSRLAAFTDTLRQVAKDQRLSHVTIEPLVSDPIVRDELLALGWRPSRTMQIDRTWLVDLTQTEADLWVGLRSKWRQYVQKARRSGVTVVERGADGLDDLYKIYVETAQRAGFVHRAAESYRTVYDAFAAHGDARLLLAQSAEGEVQAGLLLISCGNKIAEPYGGMTLAGAQSRANYLLKWEAIRRSLEWGYKTYDMWGSATAGIGQFKQGFGGYEVRYIGAFDLVRLPMVRSAMLAAQALRVRWARRGLRAPADSNE